MHTPDYTHIHVYTNQYSPHYYLLHNQISVVVQQCTHTAALLIFSRREGSAAGRRAEKESACPFCVGSLHEIALSTVWRSFAADLRCSAPPLSPAVGKDRREERGREERRESAEKIV
mmetsp:Transcript_40471/g.104899  ORF Transcript_40471/g.104899 Transcript_40471/m.104899 type:complete len:117 (-) Transcript_40471:77-427(-)